MSEYNAPTLEDENFSKTTFGFWIYLMTDCLLFGTLFITYAVLRNGIADGPSSKEIFNLPFALTETMILLTSSFTCGLALLAAQRRACMQVLGYLFLSIILGIAFLTMELTEFTHLVKEGYSWQRSAFLSSFFTLVSTHGLHITFGLLWATVMIIQIFSYGITINNFRRLTCWVLFWHFLDLIWIFIFTFVYLMGVT